MKAIVRTLIIGVAGLAAFAGQAAAADFVDSPPIYEQVPEVVPVEVGSGWYLRGDVSYDFKSETDGNYRTYVDPASPACGGACGTGYDSFGYDDWTIQDNANVGVGVGYQFTDYFRGDLTANYWESDVEGRDAGNNCLTGLCGSEEQGKATSWELMANAYVDLGTFLGVTPYLGGGVGAVKVDYDDFTSTIYGATTVETTLPGEDSWRFAYALMAGASYDLTRDLKLDVGYRYVNVEGGDMFGFDPFSTAAGAKGVQGSDNGFDRHTIQAGIRYSLF